MEPNKWLSLNTIFIVCWTVHESHLLAWSVGNSKGFWGDWINIWHSELIHQTRALRLTWNTVWSECVAYCSWMTPPWQNVHWLSDSPVRNSFWWTYVFIVPLQSLVIKGWREVLAFIRSSYWYKVTAQTNSFWTVMCVTMTERYVRAVAYLQKTSWPTSLCSFWSLPNSYLWPCFSELQKTKTKAKDTACPRAGKK